jgi:phosphate transport system protein
MNHLEQELHNLKAEMVEMADLVHTQVCKSIEALLKLDKSLAREVIFNEKRVNAYELKIDKDCENIFALFNPVANDLRFVFSTLKSNSNFERIGDNAESISHYVLQANTNFSDELMKASRLLEMTSTVREITEEIGRAYANDDTSLARSMFEKDMKLNEINIAATIAIAGYIREHIDDVENALYLLTIIRKLERTGDLITNIAEEIIFHVEAKILKHGKKTFRTTSE